MASLCFKQRTFKVLFPDDGGRSQKNVGGKIVCTSIYDFNVEVLGF
jgi:hypothetical protein